MISTCKNQSKIDKLERTAYTYKCTHIYTLVKLTSIVGNDIISIYPNIHIHIYSFVAVLYKYIQARIYTHNKTARIR